MVKATASLVPRLAGLISQFVTFCGFVIIIAGLATLQKTTNDLGSNLPQEIVDAYERTFTQSLLQPYPAQHGFQFSFIWYIITFQGCIFAFTLLLCVVPGLLHTCRPAALTLLAIAATLTINVVNNLVFLHKNPTAQQVYGLRHIDVTLAGALLVIIGNGFTILSLGIGSPYPPATTTTVKHDGVAATPL